MIAAERARARIERQEEWNACARKESESLPSGALISKNRNVSFAKYRELCAMIIKTEKAKRSAEIKKLREEYERLREERIAELKKRFAV